MTSTTTTNQHAPDQSDEAADAINADLFASHGIIPHATARLIASGIHPGPGSALEHLASTGQFDAAVLRREVEQLAVEPFQQLWRRALLGYLNGIRGDHPWTHSAIIPRDHWRRTGSKPNQPDNKV